MAWCSSSLIPSYGMSFGVLFSVLPVHSSSDCLFGLLGARSTCVYRIGSMPSYWPQQIWKSDISPKCWSAKYGMPLLFRCIGNIYFPLTTFSSCFVIKLLRRRILRGVLCGLLHSLWARVIEDSRENSSLTEARRRDEFHSLHNRWRLISLSLFL